jgi:hypothetical protein
MINGKVYTNEDCLQADCWQWLWKEHPETRRCCWHVPNGKKRSKVEAAQLKAMGVLAGVHDIHFYWQSQYYIMELKVLGNQLTEPQELYRDAMLAQGAIFYEIRTLEKFKEVITTILTQSPESKIARIKNWFMQKFGFAA